MGEQPQSNLAELTDATDAYGRQLMASVRNLVETIEIIPMPQSPVVPSL